MINLRLLASDLQEQLLKAPGSRKGVILTLLKENSVHID